MQVLSTSFDDLKTENNVEASHPNIKWDHRSHRISTEEADFNHLPAQNLDLKSRCMFWKIIKSVLKCILP